MVILFNYQFELDKLAFNGFKICLSLNVSLLLFIIVCHFILSILFIKIKSIEGKIIPWAHFISTYFTSNLIFYARLSKLYKKKSFVQNKILKEKEKKYLFQNHQARNDKIFGKADFVLFMLRNLSKTFFKN